MGVGSVFIPKTKIRGKFTKKDFFHFLISILNPFIVIYYERKTEEGVNLDGLYIVAWSVYLYY